MSVTLPFKCIALIPAAGSGQRLGGVLPKQYQSIGQVPMLIQTIRALQKHHWIQHIYIVLAPEDTFYASLCAPHVQNCTPLYVGSTTRAESVLLGLNALPEEIDDAWVCVHDAARPCLNDEDIHILLNTVQHRLIPGAYVLAQPVADTLKRVVAPHSTCVQETISRESLWQAQTPQVAPLNLLKKCLQEALSNSPVPPTDEAQALEWNNYPVQLVAAKHPNFKVTYPADQHLAEAVLQMNQQSTTTNVLELSSVPSIF